MAILSWVQAFICLLDIANTIYVAGITTMIGMQILHKQQLYYFVKHLVIQQYQNQTFHKEFYSKTFVQLSVLCMDLLKNKSKITNMK